MSTPFSQKLFSLANPARFTRISRPLLWFSSAVGAVLLVWGLYLALAGSPADYLQLEAVRIMYIHVPAAWLAMMIYTSLGLAALSFLLWKHTLAGLYIHAAAPLGAAFTAVCLITGSLWGKPTWGAWWVWDARLTSVLVLFFLYVGIMALSDAFDNKDRGLRAGAWLCLIGIVNLPVIKFSVDWWNTLHQPASVSSFSRMADPAIHEDMLRPLLAMAASFICIFISIIIVRLENEIMARRLEIMELERTARA